MSLNRMKFEESMSAPSDDDGDDDGDGAMPPPTNRQCIAGAASFGSEAIVRTFDTQYIPDVQELVDALVANDCIMIDAGCGLGKSTRIKEYLLIRRAANPECRILIFSVRIVHALNISADFADLNPTIYLGHGDTGNDTVPLLDNNFVILSWEQAHRLAVEHTAFDIVVFDEIRSGLDKVQYGSTVKDNTSFQCIWKTAGTAPTLIVADADCRFDKVVPIWLRALQREYLVWHVPYRRLKRILSVEFYTGTDKNSYVMAPFRVAVGALNAGEKLLVVAATASAGIAYALMSFCGVTVLPINLPICQLDPDPSLRLYSYGPLH